MGVLSHGIQRAAIYDPATGTTVQINDLSADFCSFDQQPAENDEVDPTGARYFGGDMSELRLRGRESGSLYSQLETWRNADTRLRAVFEGGGGFNLQWYEDDRLDILKWVSILGKSVGRADFFDLRMVRQGHGAHAIYRQVNLLAHLAAASGATYDQTIILPLNATVLTAAITNTAASGSLTLTAQNFASGSVGTANVTMANGRASVNLTLPSNTYKVRVQVTGGTSISNLSLRTDGDTVYTAY